MREESHLEDMRDAIRGDFERLKVRRGDQELMRVAAEPEASEATPVEAPPEADTEQRSWFARFLSP